MMGESSELFAVGSRRGDSGFPGEGPQFAVEDMCDSNKKETFCAVAVSGYFGERYFRSK